MVRKGIPALERDRLLYVQQNYIRPDTLSRANARLVDYQATIPLAKSWGGGEVASADGLRFIVPLRTLNAGPNPKYFGTGRGIYVTWNRNYSIVTFIMWTRSAFILKSFLETARVFHIKLFLFVFPFVFKQASANNVQSAILMQTPHCRLFPCLENGHNCAR